MIGNSEKKRQSARDQDYFPLSPSALPGSGESGKQTRYASFILVNAISIDYRAG